MPTSRPSASVTSTERVAPSCIAQDGVRQRRAERDGRRFTARQRADGFAPERGRADSIRGVSEALAHAGRDSFTKVAARERNSTRCRATVRSAAWCADAPRSGSQSAAPRARRARPLRRRRATAASSRRRPRASWRRRRGTGMRSRAGSSSATPGSSRVTSSAPSSDRRHISPVPATTYQISSTVRCETARDTWPGASRNCAMPPPASSPSSRTSAPSGASASGSTGSRLVSKRVIASITSAVRGYAAAR